MPDGSMSAGVARGATAADRGRHSKRDQQVQRRGGFRRGVGERARLRDGAVQGRYGALEPSGRKG